MLHSVEKEKVGWNSGRDWRGIRRQGMWRGWVGGMIVGLIMMMHAGSFTHLSSPNPIGTPAPTKTYNNILFSLSIFLIDNEKLIH